VLLDQALGDLRQIWRSIASTGSRAAVQLSLGTTAFEPDTLQQNGVAGSVATPPLTGGVGAVDALEVYVAQQATALEATEEATLRVQRTTPLAAAGRVPILGAASHTNRLDIRRKERHVLIM
jgi:hypothetical protein